MDLSLASVLQSTTASSGSIKIGYSYQYEGVLQAELSIREDRQNHAYTIVGRRSYKGAVNAAYLAVQVPTPETYLEIAMLNPTNAAVTVTLSIRQGGSWKSIRTLSLSPRANETVRFSSETLTNPATLSGLWTALLKADYSVTTTELISNAWLIDEKTGFSNTALLHDDYPQSNQLFATQLVSRSFPSSVLENGPVVDGSLVFVNVDDSPSVLTGSLFCDIEAQVTEIPLPQLELKPFTTQVLPLESLVMTRSAKPTMCSGQFQYSGRPGFVIGRYYAASQSKTFGLYVKLEPFVGRAYNEVYWSIREDFVPLLTITNFADEPEVITIALTEAESMIDLARATVPARGTVTVNVKDKVSVLRCTVQIKNDFGGLYIWTQKAAGKLLVKQHAISGRRLMMMPYYGGYDYITSHYFNSAPTTVDQSTYSSASVTTCYSSSGCLNDYWFIYSTNSTVLAVQNQHGVIAPRPVLGVNPGTVNLTSTASGPVDPEGTQGYRDAYPVQVEVKRRCFAQLKYRPAVQVMGIGLGNHTFWWIQTSDGTNYVTGGHPTGNCPNCGYLNRYINTGTVSSYYSEDNANASVAWNSGLSSAACIGADNIRNYALNVFPNNYHLYDGDQGALGGDSDLVPNSNTYAHWAGNATLFVIPTPPNAPGW